MQKIILYTIVIAFSLVTKAFAQEKSFEKKAKEIASNIEMITIEEKNALKKEIEAIDLQVKEGKISAEKGQELKLKIAEERAKNIETKVAIEEEKLAQLVKDKVDGKVLDSETIIIGKHSISFPGGYRNGKKNVNNKERRTTSQFVMASFVGAVVLGVLIATSVYESSKKRAEVQAQYLPDLPAPSFPVPEIPKRAEVESKQ